MAIYTIAVGETVVDGESAGPPDYTGVGAGDILEMTNHAARTFIQFIHLTGGAGDPIIIRNAAGGRCVIDSGRAKDYCIDVQDCRYIHITGQGTYEHGFHLSGYENCGIWLRNNVSDMEIDGCEFDGEWSVDAENAAGIRAYTLTTDTDYSVDPTLNLHIHHCKGVDIGASFLYIGKISVNDGVEWDGVEASCCVVNETRTDGIQTQQVTNGEIHHNFIEDAFQDGVTLPGGGVVIGDESDTIEIHHNRIVNGNRGINVDGHDGAVNTHHNLIITPDHHGIFYVTNSQAGDLIQHNTVVTAGDDGIHTKAGDVAARDYDDNIACGAVNDNVDVDWTGTGDNTTGAVAAMNFAETFWYNLSAASPTATDGWRLY